MSLLRLLDHKHSIQNTLYSFMIVITKFGPKKPLQFKIAKYRENTIVFGIFDRKFFGKTAKFVIRFLSLFSAQMFHNSFLLLFVPLLTGFSRRKTRLLLYLFVPCFVATSLLFRRFSEFFMLCFAQFSFITHSCSKIGQNAVKKSRKRGQAPKQTPQNFRAAQIRRQFVDKAPKTT